MLVNLFSYFGFLEFIKYNSNNCYCIVKYSTLQYAHNAITNLQKIKLFSKNINIQFISQDEEKAHSSDEYQIIQLPVLQNRFQNDSQHYLQINPPTKTIHISNLHYQIKEKQQILNFVNQNNSVEAIQLKLKSDLNMSHVRFKTVEDAIETLAIRHNYKFMNRRIRVSFTRVTI